MSEKFKFSREISQAPGVPETPDQEAQREEKTQKFLSEHKPSPEIEKILGGVNFSLVQRLIADEGVKAGISRDKINFVGRERIGSGGRGSASFNPEENIIKFSSEDLARQDADARRRILELYGSTEIRIVHTLIHEETHAASRNVCVSGLPELVDPSDEKRLRRWLENPKRREEEIPGRMEEYKLKKEEESRALRQYIQSGYARNLLDEEEKETHFPEGRNSPGKHGLFNVLNEGVVEKLARQLTLSYLAQSGFPQDDIKKFKDTVEQNNDEGGYGYEVSLVNAIIKKMASDSQLSEEVVWGALVRGLFEGETFSDHEVKKLFEETFGPKFLVELSQVDEAFFAYLSKNRREIIEKYKL